ncbi:hypothetical protein GS896_25835 [Rhodococcus hoagii]|nr:hypothetical protein [Prescottella equi]MBM4654072.1 hypothetical protein [Prescottella equi]MBM4654301.1 hypothetical protein [Prescottella equi]NKR23345.1 hypothetical protein [Prescottella equi]NKT56044.1 hypothetical protein [Prescottella equi]
MASSAFGNVVSAHDQASVTVEVASGRKFTGRVDGRARMTVRAEAGARGIVFAYGTGMPGVDGSSHTVELVQNQ